MDPRQLPPMIPRIGSPNMGQPMGQPPMGGMPMDPNMMPPAPMSAPPPEPLTPEALAENVLRQFADMDGEQVQAFMAKLTSQEQTLLLEIAEADPEIHDLLLAAMPLPKDYAPKRPAWFKLPGKPSPESVSELARADYRYFEPLRARFADDLDHIFNRVQGTFEQDRDRKDMARFTSTALANEINLGVAVIGSIRPSYQVPMRSIDLTDETQHAEDWLYWLDDLAERRHSRRGHGVFWRDVAFYMSVYGRVIARRVLDLDDCDDPFDEVLLDPATCCPIEGGKHGLTRITRWYQDSVVNLARDYEIPVETIRNPGGRGVHGAAWTELSPSQRVNVIEFWDEGWTCVMLEDGRIIKPIQEHHLGEVPFVHQLGGTGLPNGASDPTRSILGAPVAGTDAASSDIALKGVSRIHWMKVLNDQRESYLTQLTEALLKSSDPPVWMGVDTMAKTRERSKLGTRKGQVYAYELGHEKPDVPNFAPLPPVVAPLFEAMASEWATAAMPMVAYGVNSAANVSGSAIEGLSEAGRDKLTSDLQSLELFYGRRAEQTMRFWRDWGRLVQDAEGRYGAMTVPVLKPKTHRQNPTFELTPETIRKTGTAVVAKMTALRLQNLGALGAATVQLVQTDMMSRREAMELRGVRDPDGVFSEIDYEKALLDPTLADLRKLAALRARTGEALPPEQEAKLMAGLFLEKVQKELAASNAPPQPPGQAPPGPQAPGVSSGVAMGDYGMAPGSQGGDVGRPPGPRTDFAPPPG